MNIQRLRVRVTTTALLMALTAPAASLAQAAAGSSPSPSNDPWLAKLIAEALEARPELRQAAKTIAADRERVPQVGALPDPTVSLSIQNDGFDRLQIGRMESSYYQLMVSQGLPWPGKRALREDVARLAADQGEAAVARLRLTTEADVRRAYLGLQVARERLGLLDELERIWQRSIGTARARYEAGDGAQSDVLRGQLELNRLAQRRLSLRAEEAADLQAINRLRGHPLDEPVDTQGSVRDLPLPALPESAAAVAEAEARSPELAGARTAARQADAQVRLSRREQYPDLSIQAGVMPRGGLPPMWTAGISIGLPLWSQRKQVKAVAESEARAGAASDGTEAVEQVLRQRVAERHSALLALLDTVRIYRQGLLIQSQATAESTLAQYRVGKLTFASVLEANAGLLADREAELLAVADAQRVAIATGEVSLDAAPGAGAPGGMGGASVPGAGAAGGGGMSGGSKASAAPAAAAGGSSSSSAGM